MIPYTRTHPDVPTPTRAHPTDAGVDLTAHRLLTADSTDTNQVTIRPGETKQFGTGISVAIPTGHVGLVFVRSSIGIKRGLSLANGTGVIDSDYRGEIIIALTNHGQKATTIDTGERIAQILIMPVSLTPWQETTTLDTTERGTGGMGSTGK